MKKRTASLLKWGGIVAVVLGFAYGALNFASHRALKHEYDNLRAEGRPMELGDIIPPAIPNADNAALVYNAAMQMLQAEPPVALEGYTPPSGRATENLFDQLSSVASEALGQPTNPVAAEHIAQLLDHPRVVEFLTAIERGSQRSGYRQELDYSQGAGIRVPHVHENRVVSRTLSLLARRQASAGNGDDAWRTVLTGIRFADSLRDEPILISQLVRMDQLETAQDALREVAEVSPPTAEDCAKLETRLTSFEIQKPLVRAMDGERLNFVEWAFTLPASIVIDELLGSGKEAQFLSIIRSTFRPLFVLDLAAYLRILRQFTRSAAEPFTPEDAVIEDKMISALPSYCILTRTVVPALSGIKAKFSAMIAQTRVTRAGLAAIRFKKEHGVFPADLQALELANLDDPFTGKPLIYRSSDHGFTIYSIGANMVDDGGVKGKNTKSGDEVWQYEEQNPAKQRQP
jgi:hypothetical protein